jgi:hypothetical protein
LRANQPAAGRNTLKAVHKRRPLILGGVYVHVGKNKVDATQPLASDD